MTGFKGARPMTDEDADYLRRHHAAVTAAINRSVAERDKLIREEITRLGHDLDSGEPIPEWIIQGISERMALGEFDTPLHVRTTDHEETL